MKRMSLRAVRAASTRLLLRKHFRAWLAPGSRRPHRRPFAIGATIPYEAEVVPPALARLVKDLPEPETPDGLIKADAYQNGFTVRLGAIDALLPSVRGNEIFHLTIGSFTYTVPLEEDPISGDLSPDPVEFEIPATFAGTTPYDNVTFNMTWRVEYGAGGSSDNGLPARLTIDTVPPAPGAAIPGALIFSPDIIRNGITSQTFAGKDYIEARVPGYLGEKAGDWLRPYINGEMDTDDTHFTVIPFADSGDVMLRFYRSFIESLGDGLWSFQYDAFPREEVASQLSKSVEIAVNLKDALDDLDPPEVPAYDDDPGGSRLIDEADARASVLVRVPSIPGITTADSIEILWGDTVTAGPVRVENPAQIEITLEYAAVLSAWLLENEAADDITVDTDVRYNVYGEEGNLRGTSDPHRVEVNLHVGGGVVDPDPGTEPNENLPPLSTLSNSGNINRITLADSGLDATALVPKQSLLDDGAGGLVPSFGVGDVIRIVAADDTELARHTVTAADLTPPDGDLEITLPWAGGLGDLPGGTTPFAYWIETRAGGGTNINKSPWTSVVIEDASALPGGGTLPAVIMPERGAPPETGDGVALGHIVNGVAIGFPVDITNFNPATDTITISIPMYANRHTGTETPVPGFGDSEGQNRFVLRPPHTVREAESGNVAEPPVGEPAYTTRPPITVPHILFRLEPSRIPERHGSNFYHTHIVWTIENSVGTGTSPTDPAGMLKVTFETRGQVTDPTGS